jgi:voltage-gated potassium channel Kch
VSTPHRFSLGERLRYAFDNTLSRGTAALVAWLAAITLATIVVFAVVIVATGTAPPDSEPLSLAEAMWAALMRTLDAGAVGGDQGWAFRAVMLVVTVVGIFIFSTLIGVLGAGLEARIDELRKGRSRVIENDHTVILGWSEQIFPILTELIEANASRKDAVIVILGQKDKVEMEDAIRDRIDDTRNTRIICRTGSSIELHDLAIASIDQARAIILVAPDAPDGGRNDDPDIDIIKTLLAVTNSPQRKKERYHLIAEIRDPKNIQVARMVAKDEVELVLVGDLIARITAQTCRQSGLSTVYTELLDFGGVEFYLASVPTAVGRRFGDVLQLLGDTAVVGLAPAGGVPKLNPPMDTVVGAGDRLVVIAEDDSAIRPAPPAPVDEGRIALKASAAPTPEHTLILGWNWRGTSVIRELDGYVPDGSTVHVIASTTAAPEAIAADCQQLAHLRVSVDVADTTDRDVLDAADIGRFDHIIVLCYSDELEVARADARTLVTLLHLRDIVDRQQKRVPIVSEMLDINNRRLAEVTRADDFIVSDRLVSLMLAQISEQKDLAWVFKELFSAEGSEVYLKPIEHYVSLDGPVTFATLVAAAARAGEVAIGYKQQAMAGDASRAYGVVVAPKKGEALTFVPGDRLIVLAEN